MIHYSNVNLRMKTALNRWYSIHETVTLELYLDRVRRHLRLFRRFS